MSQVYVTADASSSIYAQRGYSYVTNEETEAQGQTVICLAQAAMKEQVGSEHRSV